jgi:hypothetical protein
MNNSTKIVIFAILVVIYVEFLSCLIGDWCYWDPRRTGRNMEMFFIYFTSGALAAFTFLYIEKNN